MLTAQVRSSLFGQVKALRHPSNVVRGSTARFSGGAAPADGEKFAPGEIKVDLASGSLPSQAEIVIVGGGVIGCSIAYHLASMGAKDVILLEKTSLTHGCTWHAAGLLGQLRSSFNLTKVMKHSVDLYSKLEAETGQPIEWNQTGSLRVASSLPRWKEIQKSASLARSFGFEMHLVSPSEAKRLCPIITTDDLHGAAWIPSDGYVEPSSLTQALALGARNKGVKIFQGATLVGAEADGRRVTKLQVKDKNGEVKNISCNKVVNCGGLWAREVGKLLGVRVCATNVEHQYLVTQPIPGLDKKLPSFRDPDALVYYKPEQRGLAVGGWEANTLPVDVPQNFGPQLYESNYERFGPMGEAAAKRCPVLNEVGIRLLINGPIPVSADGEPILGLAPERDNVFVAAGFTAGIGQGGGAGRIMAEWILQGAPAFDVWPLDIRRFGAHNNTPTYIKARAVESYGNYYALHPPGKELKSARNIRVSPLYSTLQSHGAVWGSKFGWERPNWFAQGNEEKVEHPTYDRPNWFEPVGREHKRCRENVVLFDQTSFAKLDVFGPKALEFLNRLVVNSVNGKPGSVVYTQMCNKHGGIEGDITIATVGENHFYIATGTAFGTRDFGWIETQLRALNYSDSVQTRDVTSGYAVINISGPNARKVIEKCNPDVDFSNSSFPFMSCATVAIGESVNIRALRVTFVGELGWELHVPTEYAKRVYDTLWEAGQEFNISNCGYRAIDTLRLEKGYKVWGAELNPDVDPFSSGLGFCVDFEKKDFIGRAALLAIKEKGPAKKLLTFTLPQPLHEDGAPMAIVGGEAIKHGGKVIGATTSAGFGYTIGKTIALGFVQAEHANHKDGYVIDAYNKEFAMVKQTPINRSLVDPQRTKILA